MFTDLVDSTATASRLGPEAAEDLRRVYYRLLRDRLAATDGAEVKSTGDGLHAVFPAVSAALACAREIQQAVDRHNRQAGELLGVRVGVSHGEAERADDGDYYGESVVEAARLCAAARGGQILTSELVRTLVGSRGGHEFASVGLLDLKGFREPVPVVEVRWEPATAGGISLPLPSRLVSAVTQSVFGFVGRSDELARLGEQVKRAADESRLQVLLVAGEAGIGKTALVAQAVRAAYEDGAIVLLGHCDEELGASYQPWIEVFEYLVEHRGVKILDELPAAQRLVLGRLLPKMAAVGSSALSLDRENERLLLFEAARGLLRAAASETPVVVVLDDLHWADQASVQLLRHLISFEGQMSVLVVATYRDAEVSPENALTGLLAGLHRETGVTRMRLSGLDDLDVIELMQAAAGHDLDAQGIGLAHALRRETDGNPFFTTEILRHLDESGAIGGREAGGWRLGGTDVLLPTSVREVIGHRIARLGPEANRILSLGAVVGRDFDLDVLARVADIDEDVLLDLLEAATRAAVVAETEGHPGRYGFTHALVQHTLYQNLSAARRQRTHQRIAELLEEVEGTDDPTRIADLARHWLAATRPADVTKALHYVRRAAEAALAALAPDDAVRWYAQAVELAERQSPFDPTLFCELMVGLGDAQHQAGLPEHRETLLDAADLAQELGERDLLVASVLAASRTGGATAEADERRAKVTRAALESAGISDSSVRARLLLGLAEVTDNRRWETRRELAYEAISIARRVADDPTLLIVLNDAKTFVAGPDNLAEQEELTAEALALADRLDNPVAGFVARYHRTDVCMRLGDIDAADQCIDEMAKIAARLRLPYQRWALKMSKSWRALLAGSVDEAETAADQAFEVGVTTGQPEAQGVYGAQLLEIRRHKGRLAEVVELIAQAVAANPAFPGLRALLTDIYCELGRLDDARPIFAELAAGDFQFPFGVAWLIPMRAVADASIALDEPDFAAIIYGRLRPFADQLIASMAIFAGSVAASLGRLATYLGHYSHADRYLRDALESHERIRAPYFIASTQLDRVELLLQRREAGDVARSIQLVDLACVTARERNYGGLRRRAERLTDLT